MLEIGESITYTINSEQGRIIPKNITFAGHKKSIYFKIVNQGTAGIEYTFKDTPRLNLNVINTLSIPVTIKADDFIGASTAPDTDTDDTDDTDDNTDDTTDDDTDDDTDYADDDADDNTDDTDDTDTNNDEDQFILTILTIEGNNSKKAFIYTSTPKFTIVPDTSAPPDTSYLNITIEWKLKDDTITVIIK
jgi:hypothetical protein